MEVNICLIVWLRLLFVEVRLRKWVGLVGRRFL